MSMKIGKNTMATIAYTLRYDNAQGDIVEQITERDPEEVLMGHDFMLEILEKNLDGLQAGDGFEMIIPPEQGYGAYDEDKVITVPQNELMAEVPQGQSVAMEEGDIIPIEDMNGAEYQALVLKKENGKVTLDFNHPLAGETLHFKGRVLKVRAATEEEIADRIIEEAGGEDFLEENGLNKPQE